MLSAKFVEISVIISSMIIPFYLLISPVQWMVLGILFLEFTCNVITTVCLFVTGFVFVPLYVNVVIKLQSDQEVLSPLLGSLLLALSNKNITVICTLPTYHSFDETDLAQVSSSQT